jgi:hypothetical protein
MYDLPTSNFESIKPGVELKCGGKSLKGPKYDEDPLHDVEIEESEEEENSSIGITKDYSSNRTGLSIEGRSRSTKSFPMKSFSKLTKSKRSRISNEDENSSVSVQSDEGNANQLNQVSAMIHKNLIPPNFMSKKSIRNRMSVLVTDFNQFPNFVDLTANKNRSIKGILVH